MSGARCLLLALVAIIIGSAPAHADYVRGPSSIDLTSDGHYAVIAYRRDQSVSVIDLSKAPFVVREVTRHDGIPLCPLRIRCFESTAVLIADLCGQLTVVDVPTARVVRKVEVPLYCQDVLWDAKRSRYYVSNRVQDRVLVFDGDWAEVGFIEVGRRPGPMTLGPRGRLWVANRGTFDVSVVDLEKQRELTRVYLGSRPEDLATTAAAVLVTNHGGAELERLNGVPVIEDDQTDIRNIVTSIDPASFARTELFENQGADYAGIDVRAGLLAFTGAGSGTVHVHDLNQPAGNLATLDVLADPALEGGTTPDGDRVYTHVRDVAIRSRDQILAINFLRDSMVELRPAPDDTWRVRSETPLSATGRPLLAYDSPGEPSLSERQQGQLHLLTISAWQGGQKDFTCVTCHSEWHSDFRLFVDKRPDPFDPKGRPQGPERNQSLRFVSRSAPFGWEGSIADLVEFNRSTVGRHGSLTSDVAPSPEIAEKIRLTEDILTPGPNPYATENKAGAALFRGKASCVTCHSGPSFTDGRPHDVGTGRTLDTPSLLGAWDVLRYLHDARAGSLEEVLDPSIYDSDGPPHGNLAALTRAEKADLAAYVRTLGDKRVFRAGPAKPESPAEATGSPATAPDYDAPSRPDRDSALLVPRDRIPALIQALSDPDAGVRLDAARGLRRVEREPWGQMAFVDGILTEVGPEPADAVPALIRCLEDPNGDVRTEAANALGLFGKTSLPAVPGLVQAVRTGRPESFRAAAAIALGKIGPITPDASPALVAVLREEDAPVFLMEVAAIALGRIQEGADEAVPDLTRFLETDERSDVRRFAAVALGKIGPAASSAVPALTAALSDESADVRDMAAFALGRIREESWVSVPALVNALEDPKLQVRRRAARTLGFIGADSEAAIPALAKVLRNDAGARDEASWALGRIGSKANPTLYGILRDARDEPTRLAATRALKAASANPDR